MKNRPTNSLTIDEVHLALSRPLPGLAAQLHMMPAYHIPTLRDRTPPRAPKEASVLILLYPRQGQLYLPLTLRPDTLENHRGQISLPGGAREGGESLWETALRETCEELNVCPEHWNVLGRLTSLYVPPSGFLIHPFVAYDPTSPALEPDPVEVAELIETPLALLLDPVTVVREEWEIRDQPVEVPFFNVYGHKVWGATAMILSEFITLVREV